jgi:chaperone modulatory protein CbpM
LIGTVLEDACFTLEDLACARSVSPEWIIRHVEADVLSTLRGNSADWRFTSRNLWRARQIHALKRDFDAVPALAAPVADLMQALDTPYACLRRAGLR